MRPNQKVEIVRHTYDCFEVVAYGLFGEVLRRRMYAYGRNRKAWAFEQAERWANDTFPFLLYFHPEDCYFA